MVRVGRRGSAKSPANELFLRDHLRIVDVQRVCGCLMKPSLQLRFGSSDDDGGLGRTERRPTKPSQSDESAVLALPRSDQFRGDTRTSEIVAGGRPF
jgi:hypothetical protein